MADEKKGITVKIDADLHAEIREYLERHEGMTMAEFITLAVDDELHPKIQQKGGNNMGNMRTMAFQVPEELFQRIKDYLHRNNMSQKEFVLGLIETELDREQAERESQIEGESPTEDTCEETDEEAAENGFAGECEGDNSADEETEDEGRIRRLRYDNVRKARRNEKNNGIGRMTYADQFFGYVRRYRRLSVGA